MELAMQPTSSDKTVWSKAKQDLEVFKSQPLSTQAKNGKNLGRHDDTNSKKFRWNGWS